MTMLIPDSGPAPREDQHPMIFPATERHPHVPAYKPSVYYFRKALHDSTTVDRAIVVALMVANELEQLKLWSAEQGILVNDGVAAAAHCMEKSLRQCRAHGQAIELGLFLCHELEQLKALVRSHDLIPPKWIVAPEEAEEKGWDLATGEAVDF